MTLPAKEYPQNIDKASVDMLPNIAFDGEIVVVNTRPEADKAVKYLSNFEVIGFDTETKPTFRKGQNHSIALLQLSTDERAFLFRVKTVGITDTLLALLENDKIIKVGAAVHDDIKGLAKLRKMRPAGFTDLQNVVPKYGIMEKSVQKITAIVLNARLSKAQRLTNWENAELTNSQCLYAATDAWVCRKIYESLGNS